MLGIDSLKRLGFPATASHVAPDMLGVVRRAWHLAGKSKAGRWLFMRALLRKIPYSGTLMPSIERLQDGVCVLHLDDRARYRNHLGSIHAVALANLLELAANLALVSKLPDGAEFIVTSLNIDYLKKARGSLRAEGRVDALPSIGHATSVRSEAFCTDSSGDTVAKASATVALRMR